MFRACNLRRSPVKDGVGQDLIDITPHLLEDEFTPDRRLRA